jgi:predicted nuclease of predicted toxin-antitoxin system
VKLLYDLNLSPSLVHWLDDLYPESAHVFTVGLQRLGDDAVWRYAGDHGYILVTTDADFDDMSLLLGAPPKTVRVRREKTSTRMVVDILRRHYAEIQALGGDAEARVLLLA